MGRSSRLLTTLQSTEARKPRLISLTSPAWAFDDVQAAVEVNSIGDVERTGDLSPLFPDTNPDDIPFLLRLAHLGSKGLPGRTSISAASIEKNELKCRCRLMANSFLYP
jgi:hypothetical protein